MKPEIMKLRPVKGNKSRRVAGIKPRRANETEAEQIQRTIDVNNLRIDFHTRSMRVLGYIERTHTPGQIWIADEATETVRLVKSSRNS